MNQLIENIVSETEIKSSLCELGNLLRESNNRESSLLQENLGQLLIQFNKFLKDDSLYMDTTRVVINILANNDPNRDFFTQDIPIVNQFWQCVLVDGERVGILLSQFIYETEHKSEYLKYFQKLNIASRLYELITKENINDVDSLFDVIIELLHDQDLYDNDYQFINRCLDYLPDTEEDISSTICDLVAMSRPGTTSFTQVIQLIPQIEFTSIKRKLFVLISELANSDCILLAFDNLSNKDSYIVAGCCITIGNEIESQDSYKQVINAIESNIGMNQLFKLFFNWEITDVVQIQAVHMLIKLLNQENVKYILDYETKLMAITKIALDNSRYYQEVSNLHCRLLKKIIKLNPQVINELPKLWELVCEYDNTQEIQYLLLHPNNSTTSLLPKLINNAMSPISTTSIENILEKLKAIAVLNQMVLENKIPPYIDHIQQLTSFFQQLLPQLAKQMNSDSGINQVLINNSKFIAATTYTVFENVDKVTDLLKVCQEILTI